MPNPFDQRKIIVTADGSHSILLANGHISYHSKYGAIQESSQVFIDPGLKPLLREKKSITLLELGFGTGLSALLTLLESEKNKAKIRYLASEAFPLDISDVEKLNYCDELQVPFMQQLFLQMHISSWDSDNMITSDFILHKILGNFIDYHGEEKLDLVYFDAFDPAFQPELWTSAVFKKIYGMMNQGGILVTYSSRKTVRKAMEEAGFEVSKLPGPPHKREIVRASR